MRSWWWFFSRKKWGCNKTKSGATEPNWVGHHPLEVSSNHTTFFFAGGSSQTLRIACFWITLCKKIPSRSLTARPWKSYLPNRKGSSSNKNGGWKTILSYWEGNFFRGELLNFGKVYISYPFCSHLWFLTLNQKSGFQQIGGFMNLEPRIDLQHQQSISSCRILREVRKFHKCSFIF